MFNALPSQVQAEDSLTIHLLKVVYAADADKAKEEQKRGAQHT